jgi:methylated-DNA-protein-cysteine methyltransferase related protein
LENFMANSPFFIRIKSDVLKIVLAVPKGNVCSCASIAEHLDIVPRHVAYILSSLDPLEKIQYPWHRVVCGDGKLGKLKRSESGETQSELLRAEGVPVVGNSVEPFFNTLFIPAAKLKSGIRKQTRPADAPPAKKRKIKLGTT